MHIDCQLFCKLHENNFIFKLKIENNVYQDCISFAAWRVIW